MTPKIRQGLGLLVVAVLALVLSLPAWGSESTAGGVWGIATVGTALVCGIVGAVYLATGLLRD